MDYKYKVSVIVPCYNSEKFLRETLDNLLAQTLKDIQIVLINDGSKDSTPQIIAEYASRYGNILALSQANAGVSAARNNGIEHAEGKYISFLDSDDLYSENALESMYNALELTGSDLAICRIMRFGFGGNEFNPIVDEFAKEKTIDCYDKRLLWNFLPCNKCYRAQLLKESDVRFPHLRYSEDGAFFMQFVYTAQPKITGVFDAVMKYRRLTPEQGFSVSQRIEYELVDHFAQSMDIVYSGAEKSFSNSNCADEEGYLQEILRKSYSALINEFYRMLWRGDEETLALIGRKAEDYKSRMLPETLQKCHAVIKDIGTPLFSKKEIAEKPFISVIAKNAGKEFTESLKAQSMPVFELITTANGTENALILPPKNFSSSAKKAAKGKITVRFSGRKPIGDARLFKVISLLKRNRIFGMLPDFAIKAGAVLFLKIKK